MDEPLIGAECARQLGRPEAIRELAQALKDTGTGLDQLLSELRRQVADLVPREWDGAGATGFQDHTQREMDAVRRASERTQRLAQAALTFAGKLDEAWAEFVQAQVLCLRYQLTIGRRGADPCGVYPLDMSGGRVSREVEDAHIQAMRHIEVARQIAEVGRQQFRWTVTEDWRQRLEILTPLGMGVMMSMVVAGARPRASYLQRGSRHRPPHWEHGEIKPHGQVDRGLNQLLNRPGTVPGRNYGLATYDEHGNAYFHVFRLRRDHTWEPLWSRHIGTIPPHPQGYQPGSTQYGGHAELHIRGHVSRFDGRNMNDHLVNSGGVDLLPR
ncbi:MAG TPA: WXG100 family type VII secretion target [Candidatus Limnocylindrales bacterium]|nr:WXG100 family type VII secretion target [Candidatus Limnocylindrales bacterium]